MDLGDTSLFLLNSWLHFIVQSLLSLQNFTLLSRCFLRCIASFIRRLNSFLVYLETEAKEIWQHLEKEE